MWLAVGGPVRPDIYTLPAMISLYPAVDIRGGSAVRLVQGDFERETVYDGDPADAGRKWVRQGADRLHVVDLDGARAGEPVNLEHVRRLAGLGVPVQLGGGLRTLESIGRAIDSGVRWVVIGTAAIRDPVLVERAVVEYGDRIVVSVDCRGGRVATGGWTETTDVPAQRAIAALEAAGVGRFVVTEIEVDGTLEGPPLGTVNSLGEHMRADLIWSGGVGSLDDLRALASAGIPNLSGVIVGKALYEGRFDVADAIDALGGPSPGPTVG